MGQAKRNKNRHRKFLEYHKFCCFCGGDTPATTVDHVPSRQMFAGRRRPKGLEVPACVACNDATRLDEQVAAMVGRIYPDSETPEGHDEIRKILKAIGNNNPGLLEELQPSRRQIRRFSKFADEMPQGVGGVLNCRGPLVNQSIKLFGAKLGFALYYTITGRIVPSSGGVAVIWYTNFDRFSGRLPQELFQFFGSPETLRQGTWHVSDQFEYACAPQNSVRLGAYLSTFRKSFAVLSWVCEDVLEFSGPEPTDICRPSFVFKPTLD